MKMKITTKERAIFLSILDLLNVTGITPRKFVHMLDELVKENSVG